jgi:hypothetical protein
MTSCRLPHLSCTLAVSLLAGCAADAATDDDILEEAASDRAASTPPVWYPLGSGCADTIAVASNDVLWVTGCDGRPDNSVWYMRYELSCVDGICAELPAWHDNRFAGARITVDNHGNATVVTSGGFPASAIWATNQSTGTDAPTGRWTNTFTTPDCVNQLTGYVIADDGVLGFESPQRTVTDDAFHYFSTICNADLNGNSPIRHMEDYRGNRWLPANGSGQLLATFFRPVGSSPQVTLVTSAADGSMWAYDEGREQFSGIGSPPALTYSLTDHFAATDDGVYQYDDATGGWTHYIENTTQTGRIVQIAHAGVTRVVRADGTAVNIGPSSLWGVDDSGQIYSAVTIVQPR